MAIAGALIGDAIGAFGKKPKVPTLADISPDLIQKETVAGNIANFADIAKLAASTNTFNQEQLEALLDRALGPGVRQQITDTISSRLRGDLSPGTVRAISNYQASRGGSLTRGSGFLSNAASTQLGLTAEQQVDRGLSSAESWLASARAPMLNAASMFFTPQERLGFSERQQALKFNRDMIAAGVKAAPDPGTAALGREIDRFFNTAASVGTMAAGGGMGGMGGGMAPGGGGGLGASTWSPYQLGGYSLSGSADGQGVRLGYSSF